MHGIAFSASYQMVARFANKNTISLGLGCVGSGLLALALEVVLEVGPKPTRTSFIILFEIAAGGLLPCFNSNVTVCKCASVVVCMWWIMRNCSAWVMLHNWRLMLFGCSVYQAAET